MIPKLHSKGSSFKGAAAYLLHDTGRAETSERVAWTGTLNLATSRPELAWRIMAATAMNQGQLKEAAGIPNTGRKSKKHVLHLSLSWSPEEAGSLDRDEMMRATLGALKALGAEDRQALIICHSDEAHPHVHILLNRVSSKDGRMLSSSKEKLSLSRWAQRYEERRGKVYCEDRVINNEARDRGEHTRGEEVSRAAYEKRQKLRRDRQGALGEAGLDETALDEEAQAFAEEEKAKDAAIAETARTRKAKSAAAWEKLLSGHRKSLAAITYKARRETARRKAAIRKRYRPEWRRLRREEEKEKSAFESREETLLGKVQNVRRAMELRKLIREGKGRRAVSDTFRLLASRGARRHALIKAQKKHRRDLLKKQRTEEKQAAESTGREKAAAIEKERRRFKAVRAGLILTDTMSSAAERSAWAQRAKDRNAALASFNGRRSFNRAAYAEEEARERARRRVELTKARREGEGPEKDRSRD